MQKTNNYTHSNKIGTPYNRGVAHSNRVIIHSDDNFAPIAPIILENNYVDLCKLDRSDSGPLNTPIKKKPSNKLYNSNELNSVKKKMGHIFNFILENNNILNFNNKRNDNLNEDEDEDEYDEEYEDEYYSHEFAAYSVS